MVKRVCLVSGGTGGHLMPAIVLARVLRERGHEPLVLTEGREVERAMVGRDLPEVRAMTLPGEAAQRRPSRLGMPLWVARTTLAARRLLRAERIDCVVSTGGRASVPVGLAAKSLGVPLYLLEQNAVTGRANRALMPFCTRVYHGLPTAKTGARGLLTGTPLRADVGRIDRAAARAALGLPDGGQVVLVMGGSQGARVLNELVPQALASSSFRGVVVHLAGAGGDDVVRERYQQAGRPQHPGFEARVSAASGDMGKLYAAADLVVCRGGGSTVAELSAAGRAAVIVPYPHHKDQQQLRNAEVLVRAGGAVVVEERDLTLEWLTGVLDTLLADPLRLSAMGANARAQWRGDAAVAIAEDIERQSGWAGLAGDVGRAGGVGLAGQAGPEERT